MNTQNPSTGEIRPNSANAFSLRVRDGYDAVTVALEQAEAILRLIVKDSHGAVSCHAIPALFGLEKLLTPVDDAHSRLCAEAGDAVETLLKSGCLLDQARAVLGLVLDAVIKSAPDAGEVFNGLCALESLLKLFRAELARALDALAPARQAGAEEARP